MELSRKLADTPARPHRLHRDAQRRERDGTQELETEPGDRHPLGGLVTLESGGDQGRGRPAVERAGVPRATGQLAGKVALAVELEDGLAHRLERSQEKPRTAR